MQILDILAETRQSWEICEAQNYESMFNDLLGQHANDIKLREQIKLNIDWARKTLKKNDRIVWFLRWVKVWLSAGQQTVPANPAPPGNPALAAVPQGNPALAAYNQRYRTAYTPVDLQSIQQMKQELTHFFGLPISEVQNHVFRNESPYDIVSLFRQYEKAWRQRMEEEKSLISPEDEDEVLLNFPDGYAWWLLDRGSCSVEAKAMGHCGNVPSERRGDRILSLRRKVQRGDKELWYPVATFILDDSGYLGEMKGRNNDKPIEKYHPYIIALLQHDLIEGIRGGGYMPSHNFSMNDLDPQTREELIGQKPNLASFYDFYQKEGMSERVLSMLSAKMSDVGLPKFDEYDAANKQFLLDSYRDLETFVRANDDTVVGKLLELRDRATDARRVEGVPVLSVDQLYEFLDRLPDRVFAELANSLRVDPTDPNSEMTIARYVDRERGDLYHRIEDAFRHAYGDEDLLTALDRRIGEYVKSGWYFECSYVWVVLQNPADLYNSPVEILISERDLVDLTDAAGTEDDDYGWEAQRVIHDNSWDTVSWDNLNERRQEEGLVSSGSGRGWNATYEDTEFPDPDKWQFEVDDLIDQAVDAFVSGRATPTINDPRQLQLPLGEAFFDELRRRAGIHVDTMLSCAYPDA